MKIFTKLHNWLSGKPEPLTAQQKIGLAMQNCLNKIKKSGHCGSHHLFHEKNNHTNHKHNNADFHEHVHEAWKKVMNSPEKKMSRGSENIFRIIKSRFNWGNTCFWKHCDQHRHLATKYGKSNRGHNS